MIELTLSASFPTALLVRNSESVRNDNHSSIANHGGAETSVAEVVTIFPNFIPVGIMGWDIL